MPICYKCCRNFDTLRKLICHINDIHGPNVKLYVCGEKNCSRSYKSQKIFGQHFKNKHIINNDKEQVGRDDDLGQILENLPSCGNSPSASVSDNADFSSSGTDYLRNNLNNNAESSFNESNNLEFDVTDEIIKFILKLYHHASIPRNQIQKIICNFHHFFETFLSSLKTRVENVIHKDSAVRDKLSEIDVIFHNFKDSFQNFRTEHRAFKEFEKRGLLIKPIPYNIGQYVGVKKVGNKRVPAAIDLQGHFIPLKKLFEVFFNKKDVLKIILNYQRSLEADTSSLSNIIQGEYWKEKFKGDQRTLIPFLVYNDDYLAANPLSSHSSIHKLSGTYISFPTLPPMYRSKLENIFMALLFHSSDRKKFGNFRTFCILIDEINLIHEKGIKISTDDFKDTIFPRLCLLSGDNLGLHEVCGFATCFTATYPCIECKMNLKEVRSTYVEDISKLRNRDNYKIDLEKKNVTKTGIKENCCFNEIKEFHCTENITFDSMHDLLRGICNYDLCLVLNYLIPAHFSLQTLNDRIDNYDYGPIDNANRPLSIYAEELAKGQLKMTASETLVFVTHLGLIIGDKVPVSDPFWKLYLLLRQIMEIVFAPTLCEESIEKLSSIVEEHNKLYVEISDHHLTVKFHNMIHYKSHIKKFGPLVHLWAMRFEGKHKPSKTAANAITSRRNITFSLSLKHQLQMMSLIFHDFEKCSLDSSPKSYWIQVQDFNFQVETPLPEAFSDPLLPLLCTDWVKYNGILYAEGNVVLYGVENNMPTFFSINSIFMTESDDVYFLCENIQVIEFVSHFHAYQVELLDTFMFMNCKDIKIHSPCAVSVTANGTKFITLRHKW